MAQQSQSRPSILGHGEANRPIQQLPLIPYCPESKGITVVQQYFYTISEEASPSNICALEGDIWHYDLIGAVGLKTSRQRAATVVYHVKWKGFPISDMTWEPESHFSQSDLEELWSTHGRVNSAGKVVKFGREDDESHQSLPDRSSVSPQRPAPSTIQLSNSEFKPVEPRTTLLPNTVSTTTLLRLSGLPWL